MNLVRFIIKKINSNQRGGAILEFSLVVPLLLSLSFAGFEFSRSLKILQIGSTLSREAANLAFRRCAVETGTALTSCLQGTANGIVNFSRITLPNVSIILSVYQRGTPITAAGNRTSIVAATSSTAYTTADIISNSHLDCGTNSLTTRPFSRICRKNADATKINFKNASGSGAVDFTINVPITTAANISNLLVEHGLIISAESYIEYQPIVGVIGKILNIQGQRYYDATLI